MNIINNIIFYFIILIFGCVFGYNEQRISQKLKKDILNNNSKISKCPYMNALIIKTKDGSVYLVKKDDSVTIINSNDFKEINEENIYNEIKNFIELKKQQQQSLNSFYAQIY
jgi:hypothetical protein